MSIRALARRHRCGRATVRMALANTVPPPRKTPVRSSPRLEPFKKAMGTMLLLDVQAPRK